MCVYCEYLAGRMVLMLEVGMDRVELPPTEFGMLIDRLAGRCSVAC